tara:strand:- start:10 stop:423 length:414 start_codon:yes stop_codon:yes gene_type:complete
MSKKQWSDRSILKSIKNPESKPYEIKIKNPEITFLGSPDQPDFARVFITFYPTDTVIELKSLKKYFFQFRSQHFSYERLINVVYDDLMHVYEPERLRIVMIFNARGGISSRLTVDSDWKVRGGSEKYADWVGQSEEW